MHFTLFLTFLGALATTTQACKCLNRDGVANMDISQRCCKNNRWNGGDCPYEGMGNLRDGFYRCCSTFPGYYRSDCDSHA